MIYRPDEVDECAEWFDYWIDTYAHPGTSLFASSWHREGQHRSNRAVIGTVENGGEAHIYDIERSSAT